MRKKEKERIERERKREKISDVCLHIICVNSLFAINIGNECDDRSFKQIEFHLIATVNTVVLIMNTCVIVYTRFNQTRGSSQRRHILIYIYTYKSCIFASQNKQFNTCRVNIYIYIQMYMYMYKHIQMKNTDNIHSHYMTKDQAHPLLLQTCPHDNHRCNTRENRQKVVSSYYTSQLLYKNKFVGAPAGGKNNTVVNQGQALFRGW